MPSRIASGISEQLTTADPLTDAWCDTSPAAGVPRHTGRSEHVRSSVINNAQGKMVVNISSGHISSQFSVQTQLKT